MSAETPRRTRSQPVASSGPAVITPQQVNDRSIIDSVAGFINEVVPAAYSTPTETKDQLQWVHFEHLDKNQFILDGDETKIAVPLIVVLGYGSGVQIWAVPINGDATEVLSWRHGSVRVLRILSNPQPNTFNDKVDVFADKRPLIVLCDTATPGPQYYSLSFISLKTGEQVKNIKFKNPVLDVQANKRSVVVTFAEKIAIFDAYTLEDRLTVTTCYLSPGISPNPVALGTRWLAYAEKKLIPSRRSGGGNEGEGVQSYTATVLHAAKSLGKGLRELGETVASSLAGSSTASVPHAITNVSADMAQPGVVTILDLQNTDSSVSDRGLAVESVVAHFTAHSEAIVCLQFDPSGMLLLTADKRGHDFHLFRIQPHPGGPSLGAVHHLYTLHRGDTSAKVQDMCFSPDSRWVAVSTLRGTTHVFPITPYGGAVGMRTHATPHVVNRMSRFQRSAGLPVEVPGRSNSPVSHHEIPVQSGIPYRNPRLPPYPHSTVVHPLAQLRQTLNLPIATTALTQRTNSGRSRLGSSSEDSMHVALRVAACFAAPRAWLETINQPTARDPAHKQRRPVESLFVISSHGTLIQYDLEPKHATQTPKERVCDDTAIELKVNAKAQWSLQRQPSSCDIQPPVHPDNILLSTIAGENETRYPKRDYTDDRWLSQVEIVTHAGPHRRLWMGPQFTFKMYNGTNGSPVSVLESMEAMEVNVESPLKPARSKPLNMPDDGIPVLIESGSASSFEQSPRLLEREITGNCGELQLKEDLADAMLESPGRSRDNNGGRCVLVSVKHNAHIVAKVVNPLGTVVTLRCDQSNEEDDAPHDQDQDDCEIHENCDESLFRPVVTTIPPPSQPKQRSVSSSPTPTPPQPPPSSKNVKSQNKTSEITKKEEMQLRKTLKKEEEARKKLEEERLMRKKAEEERLMRKKAEELEMQRKLEEERQIREKEEREAYKRAEEERQLQKKLEEEQQQQQQEEEITITNTKNTRSKSSERERERYQGLEQDEIVHIPEKEKEKSAPRKNKKTKTKLGVRVSNPIIIEKPTEDEIEPIIIEHPNISPRISPKHSPKIMAATKCPPFETKHIIRDRERSHSASPQPQPTPPLPSPPSPEMFVPENIEESAIPEDMWSSVEGTPFVNKMQDQEQLEQEQLKVEREEEEICNNLLDAAALIINDAEIGETEETEDDSNVNNNGSTETTESDDSNKVPAEAEEAVVSVNECIADDSASLPVITTLSVQKSSKKKPKKKRK